MKSVFTRLLLLTLMMLFMGHAHAIVDTDGDGLSDADEVTNGTNPANWDSDFDGLSDGHEVGAGEDPLVARYQVSAGGHTCMLADSGVMCRGVDTYGQSTVPTGLSGPTQVSAGSSHSCAIDSTVGL